MKCQHKSDKCFALGAERECLALSDTTFGRACPFFKPSKTDYNIKYVFEGRPGVWKKIRGYEGKYYISDRGEVMNSRKTILKVNYRNNRAYISLESGENIARYYIERLVADAFVPKAGQGKVCHKDGNTLNCCADNLYRSK